MDAVSDDRSDGSRDEAGSVHGMGYLGANVGLPIATNEEFAVLQNLHTGASIPMGQGGHVPPQYL